MSKVIHVTSKSQYDQAVKAENLVVVDFTASWCGPCKRISPFLDQLSTQYENVTFLKVDVDEVQAVAQAEGISAMPTFYFYKGGKKVADLVGASQDQLKHLVDTHK